MTNNIRKDVLPADQQALKQDMKQTQRKRKRKKKKKHRKFVCKGNERL
jgi:hypothetical protein